MASKQSIVDNGAIQRDLGTLFQLAKDIQSTVVRVEQNQKDTVNEMKVVYATKLELDQVKNIAEKTSKKVEEELPKITEQIKKANSIFGIGSRIGKVFLLVLQSGLTTLVTLYISKKVGQ